MEEGGRESDGKGREGEGGDGRGKEGVGGRRERGEREMEEGGERERWMGLLLPVSILGAGHRLCVLVFVHGPWPSMGGCVLICGRSMFMGGSWSSVGT